jgi:outer membrane lipoprotein SlyB
MLMFTLAPIGSAQTRRHRRHTRTFWQKHRDKLTVAGTTAAGAGTGAIIGGKKGALIGTAAGAGTGALYTYKIRKRHRRRY